MGRMNPPEVPVEFVGATAGAIADQRRQAERERIRQAEDRCRQNVEGAWRWIDSRPRLVADDRLALFAAQAITLGRVPAGLTSRQLEDWITNAAYSASNGSGVSAGTRGLVGGGQGVYRPVNSESGGAQT